MAFPRLADYPQTHMDEKEFEGTIILEQLARVGAVEEFMAAVDSQDEERAIELMQSAGIDETTINIVLKKMADPYDEH